MRSGPKNTERSNSLLVNFHSALCAATKMKSAEQLLSLSDEKVYLYLSTTIPIRLLFLQTYVRVARITVGCITIGVLNGSYRVAQGVLEERFAWDVSKPSAKSILGEACIFSRTIASRNACSNFLCFIFLQSKLSWQSWVPKSKGTAHVLQSM